MNRKVESFFHPVLYTVYLILLQHSITSYVTSQFIPLFSTYFFSSSKDQPLPGHQGTVFTCSFHLNIYASLSSSFYRFSCFLSPHPFCFNTNSLSFTFQTMSLLLHPFLLRFHSFLHFMCTYHFCFVFLYFKCQRAQLETFYRPQY